MLEILDSLIATIGVVLVLSLIVQAIQQIIKQGRGLKSKYMERELFALFEDSLVHTPTVKSIRSQYKSLTEGPSKSPAVGMINEIKQKLASVGFDDLSLLETMKKKDFIKLLEGLPSLRKAKDSLQKAKDDVEDWYDVTMKAFQDHYERRMKLWSYVLSFLVVAFLNQNVFQVYKEFSSNKTLRDSAVKMAERMAAVPRDRLIQSSTKADSLLLDSLAMGAIKRNIAYIDSLVNQKSYSFMRWNFPNSDTLSVPVMIWNDTKLVVVDGLKNLFGWLAMTLLVGLGAPFWYDFLQSLMGVKNMLKVKKESPEEEGLSVRKAKK
jgi:hypothetical protein